MKFLLFSDLHLDSAFAWLGGNRAAARRLRNALRDTLSAILRLAQQENVDAVLCGGDLYEQERFAPDTALFLRSSFAALHPTPVLIAPGNHDWFGPGSLYQQVEWPPNVRIFADSRLSPMELEHGLTLWGAAHTGPAMSTGFLSGFQADRQGTHLALFHGSDSAWLHQQGEAKRGHAPFAAEEISEAGFLHAFLGHYHAPKDCPAYTYPGNPQPLSFGEEGVRGAVLACVAQDGRIDRRRVSVKQVGFSDLSIDVTGAQSSLEIRDRIQERTRELTGVARITLDGDLPPDLDLQWTDLQPANSPLDACVVRPGSLRPAYDLERIAAEPTVRGQFVRTVREAGLEEQERRRILITGLRALDGRQDLEVP